MTTSELISSLDRRRRKLGLSCAALARRADVSLRTVQRILANKASDPGLSTIVSLANALGSKVDLSDEEDANLFRFRHAKRKAERIVALVQGTSALDSKGLTPNETNDLREQTVRELLAGTNRKLWAE